MEIIYDTDTLKAMLFDLAELTGITISVYDYEGRHLADSMHGSLYCINVHHAIGHENCQKCSHMLVKKCRKSFKYEECICFMGLYEACMPIIKDNIWVGHISLAGIRTADSLKTTILEENESTDLFNTQPFYTQKQIDALKNILPKIIFDSAITFKYSNRFDEIAQYIKNNLNEKLTVEHLCNKFHINKNSLYNIFKQNIGITVNEYIVDKRIDKAKMLMQKGVVGEKLIDEIGIENYSYFCRLFKKKTSLSPTDYCKKFGISLK